MSRFLRYTVEAALAGEAESIKEYRIGVDVFDRGSTYDPRVDPIVRVEARRLRDKLCAYYEGDGQSDSILIEFEKGTYVPAFCERTPGPPPPQPQPVGGQRVAVLPFTSIGPGTDHEYFIDGLIEELIHALTRVEELCVVAWNSATHFRGPQQDLRAIGQQLGAASILTGSVRMSGTQLRVRAQLIDAERGVYLWSETYDRELSDVFAIQEEIARAIVRTLRIELSGRNAAAPQVRNASNLGAYDLYLRGRYHWNKRTADDLNRAVHFFMGAIALDERSALAHAGLADAYSLLADFSFAAPGEAMPKAREAALRAIELNPELAEAWNSLAFIRSLYDWEWGEAEQLYRRSIELNPGYATAHFWYAIDYLALVGRFDEAAAEMERALQLDPLAPSILDGRGTLFKFRRDFGRAVEYYLQFTRTHPDYFRAWSALGRAWALAGEFPRAVAALERARELGGEVPNILGALGQVHACAGCTDRSRSVLARLHELAAARPVYSGAFALIHMALGETGQALDWLERGCENRELPLSSLRVHPVYDPLRGEARFQAILRRIWGAAAAA